MSRATVTMFGIDTINEYLAFCDEALREFKEDQGNVVRAFAAILAINHVSDWLQHKLTAAEATALGLPPLTPKGEQVKQHFEGQNPDVKLIREVANGLKHLSKTTTAPDTSRVSGGFGEGPYGVGPFDSAYLLIDQGPSPTTGDQFVDAYSFCRGVLNWWRQKLQPITV